METILAQIVEGISLSESQAEFAMEQLMKGAATQAQIGSFLTALRMKGETVEEIAGFAKSMRKFAACVPVAGDDHVDTCGTGGSGISSFNISTAAGIVAAAGGVPIAKHGNRKVTSKSGSADVLEQLGVRIDLTPNQAADCLKTANMVFMLAPYYHQAMKHAMQPRRELKFRTVLNFMGPLLNPAGAKRQVIGVSSRPMVEKLAHVLNRLGVVHAIVVHGEDGLDELSVSHSSFVAEVKEGQVKTETLTPEQFGLSRYPLDEICCNDPEHSASIIRAVLAGEKGAARDIVLFNAAASLYVGGKAATLAEGVDMSSWLIDSGLAREQLDRLIRVSQGIAASEATA